MEHELTHKELERWIGNIETRLNNHTKLKSNPPVTTEPMNTQELRIRCAHCGKTLKKTTRANVIYPVQQVFIQTCECAYPVEPLIKRATVEKVIEAISAAKRLGMALCNDSLDEITKELREILDND